jgi:uncharacterized protein (DUF1501 family)
MKTRRDFLRIGISAASALSAAGSLGKLSEISAFAAGRSDYRALVCVFLAGGNDAHNMIVPSRRNSRITQRMQRPVKDWESRRIRC